MAQTSVKDTKGCVVPHLPKAALAQHHQEVEIRKFHPISAPVVVELGNGVCRLLLGSLGPCGDLGSLQRWRWDGGREKTRLRTGWGKVVISSRGSQNPSLTSSSPGQPLPRATGTFSVRVTGTAPRRALEESPAPTHCAVWPVPRKPLRENLGTASIAPLPLSPLPAC